MSALSSQVSPTHTMASLGSLGTQPSPLAGYLKAPDTSPRGTWKELNRSWAEQVKKPVSNKLTLAIVRMLVIESPKSGSKPMTSTIIITHIGLFSLFKYNFHVQSSSRAPQYNHSVQNVQGNFTYPFPYLSLFSTK